MLVAILGAPTALTYAGLALVNAIADSGGKPHRQIAAVFVDDLRKAWAELPEDAKKQVLIVSDLPSTPLLDLIRASRVPVLVFVDDFEAIVDQLQTRGMALRAAVRHATQVLCAIDQVRGNSVLRVTPVDGDQSLSAVVESLCSFLGVEKAAETGREVLTRLGHSRAESVSFREYVATRVPPASGPASASRGDPFEQAMVKFVARQYAKVGSGADVAQIAWPTELFFQVDPPRDFLEGPTNLVGPARFLSYGPYLHLPKGSWSVSITIEIAENFSGNHLAIDVAAGVVLAAGEAALPVSGIFNFDLSFEIVDPFIAIEVRSQILSGAIEGKLAMREVAFRRKQHLSP